MNNNNNNNQNHRVRSYGGLTVPGTPCITACPQSISWGGWGSHCMRAHTWVLSNLSRITVATGGTTQPPGLAAGSRSEPSWPSSTPGAFLHAWPTLTLAVALWAVPRESCSPELCFFPFSLCHQRFSVYFTNAYRISRISLSGVEIKVTVGLVLNKILFVT